MKECKIIQNLLPSYIDKLTDEETNKYIEEHLKQCEECKNALEDMQKELNSNTTRNNIKEVKYIKKYNNKMKTLKTILLAIVLIFVLAFARKLIIISSLHYKIDNYNNSTNYYMKQYNYSGETLTIFEYYNKDDKHIRKVKYINENGKNVYTDQTSMRIPNIETDIFVKYLITPLFSTVISEQCNGVDCYRINTIRGAIYYIDKETGLPVRIIGDYKITNSDGLECDAITDFQYKFEVVTDEDFSEYELQEEIVENKNNNN